MTKKTRQEELREEQEGTVSPLSPFVAGAHAAAAPEAAAAQPTAAAPPRTAEAVPAAAAPKATAPPTAAAPPTTTGAAPTAAAPPPPTAEASPTAREEEEDTAEILRQHILQYVDDALAQDYWDVGIYEEFDCARWVELLTDEQSPGEQGEEDTLPSDSGDEGPSTGLSAAQRERLQHKRQQRREGDFLASVGAAFSLDPRYQPLGAVLVNPIGCPVEEEQPQQHEGEDEKKGEGKKGKPKRKHTSRQLVYTVRIPNTDASYVVGSKEITNEDVRLYASFYDK
ncbi:uncharacterized protein EMH_0094290 [Eimeria mitis]|uniref:Uncharacterized protein n=1 Tax=Eimeria mitis TaxID=44415 RepID=U6KKA7_9EIME|nr:uncharacterized protein EMH_0094290 [Eimeria mitis]CDJ36717.1 hypothetical protein, conserved [Eimeria mitis]